MPCMDGYEPEYHIVPLERKVDELTALLCKACSMLEESGDLNRDGELTAWYTQHIKQDYARITQLMGDIEVTEGLSIKTLRAIEKLIDADIGE